MSHLTTVKTSLNDSLKIERALTWLGLKFNKNASIRTWNKVETCEFVVVSPNRWDIGLKQDADGLYQIFGDSVSWGGIAQYPKLAPALGKVQGDARKEVFAGILTQACAITTAIIEATKLGHTIEVGEPDENGTIHARIVEA
jgi:hypothetical protein